jgi:AcrR family transcriptional regulator
MTLLPRPSVRTQRRLTRAMQGLLVAVVAYGVLAGQTKAITNGIVALLVTVLPARLERNYELPLDPWLGLWITAAVFLHTLGSAGFYGAVGWWDHLTHATSASLVAGVGYTAARAIDLHSDQIAIPRRFAFVYIFVVVLSFGVVWELFEFGLDALSNVTGVTMPLAQKGLDDTVRDLMFNSLGALLVALFGQVHLSPLAESVRERFLAE